MKLASSDTSGVSNQAQTADRSATPTREELRRARRLLVSGEAAIFTIFNRSSSRVVDASELRETWRSADFQSFVTKSAQALVKKHLGKKFEVDSVIPQDDSITVAISGHSDQFDAERPSGLTGASRSAAGQTLLADVDRTLELMRRSVRDQLRKGAHWDTRIDAQWTVGRGVEVIQGSVDPDAPEANLSSYLMELKNSDRRLAGRLPLLMIFGLAMVTMAVVLTTVSRGSELVLLVALYFAIYGLGPLALAYFLWSRRAALRDEIREVTERLDLRALLDKDEQRAQKLFQIQGFSLQRYHDQALRQRSLIFGTGLLCILGGFAAVGAAFFLIYNRDQISLGEKIVVASLGAASGILANFVAIIFLKMFTTTVRSMVDFHNRLVLTYHVHFGNVLAVKIKDDQLRAQTLSRMAIALAEPHEDEAGEPQAAATSGDANPHRNRWAIWRR
jgi:hypothetical protein